MRNLFHSNKPKVMALRLPLLIMPVPVGGG